MTVAPAAIPTVAPDDAAAAPAGAALLRRHARTFSLAARLLPGAAARDLAVLYGFCRRLDDAVDEAPSPAAAKARLSALLAELDGRAAAEPSAGGRAGDGAGAGAGDPVVHDFAALARARGIPRRVVDELVRGVASDLGPVRMADERAIVRYAYRVAGTVGLMIAAVLEVPERAHPHAIDLGIGMQLTNVARDVGEDARRGRVYLPATWVHPDDVLAATGAGDETAARGGHGGHGGHGRHGGSAARGGHDDGAAGRTLAAVRRLLELAETHYRLADGGMVELPAAVRPGILAASRNYEAIGERVRRRGAIALRTRSRVGAAGRLLGLARATASAGRIALAGARAFVPHDDARHVHLDGLPRRLSEART